MERSTKKNGLINLAILLLVAVAGFGIARLTHSLSGELSSVIMAIGVLVAAVSWFQMRLEEREYLERLELDELAKNRGSGTLFEGKDAESFPAQRSREQFERFFVPGFTALLFVAEAAGAYFIWKGLSRPDAATDLERPTLGLALFGLFALILFLLGKFSATIARIENHRLLRPGAAWVLLSAYLCFAVTVAMVIVEAGFPNADLYAARGLAVLLAVIAFETLLNLILEIYRPRIRGKVVRPLYESRVVGLLGQPEGLITTAAQALDYQFGFKVSDTWFYRFFERALGWLLLLQLGILFLSTCVVFIEPGEQGVLEHLGRPVPGRTILNPGAHLKWPWPFDRVYRFHTEQVQSFDVGFTPDPQFENAPAQLWNVPHANEENFLVANREPAVSTNAASGTRSTPPVSLLTVSIPVQFQITNLLHWVYNNDQPTNLLRNIATREVVRQLVSADINEIMSTQRGAAAAALQDRVQQAAVQHQLGVRIVFVGLQDIHPPTKVAPDYEKVIGAKHQKQARILAAQAAAIATNAVARGESTNLINRAIAQRVNLEIGAKARAGLFTNQIPAFAASPSIYMQRSYLDAFARASAQARKYVILTTNTQDVISIDLQDRIRGDLLGELSVTPEN
ncbi:MAG TPA: SPFH domain-containing protein [Verrucomicrobiae bacterium]|nr:SPFH domain-containing protein [Verrucomicrobiae bacterium]